MAWVNAPKKSPHASNASNASNAGVCLACAATPSLPRIRAILEKYADLPVDFADASLVALCERLKIWDIASGDSDFTIYRGRDKRRFNNRFFEA